MARFDIEKAGRLLSPSGWSEKNNTAAEYKVGGDHNYRTYKPSVAGRADGGLQIIAKLDHIRGGAPDDRAVVNLNFNKDGVLENAKVDMIIQGHPQVSTDLIGPGLIAAGTSAGTAAAVAIAVEIGKQLLGFINGFTKGGGRLIFPNVVELNINHFSTCVTA